MQVQLMTFYHIYVETIGKMQKCTLKKAILKIYTNPAPIEGNKNNFEKN